MKITGVSREVMDLLSGNQDKKSAALPPIVPTIPPAIDTTIKVGNKYISASKPARKWVWAPFASSARTDGAMFRHWVRANVEYPDYPYARFDVHLDTLTYTDDEYNRLLPNSEWTKSETDKLVELTRVFELRWAVIHDRWCEAYPLPERRVEDLQHRYYSVATILLQQRVTNEATTEVATLSTTAPVFDPVTSSVEAKAVADHHLMETAAARALATARPEHQPLMASIGTGSVNKNVFDLTKERERRAHLDFLWNRTKEEEFEEAELRKELRLVEAQIRKLKKSGGHILAAASQRTGGVPSAASSQNPSRSVSPAVPPTNIDAGLLDQCFASTAPTPVSGTPYLQSGRLVPPAVGGPLGLNKTTLKRMETVLGELKIPPRPLPTKRVCDLYDSVRKGALTLLTLQKMVIQKEAQLQSKRLRLAKMGGGGRVVDEETLLGIAPPPAAVASAPGSSSNRTKSSSGKTKKNSSGKGKGTKSGDAGNGDTTEVVKAALGGRAVPGGKTVPVGKAAKKQGTKRKKKPPEATTAAATAGGTNDAVTPTAIGGGATSAAKGASSQGDSEGKASKKRLRKT
jgi:DNA methyltransferase 1-associated protein 1